MDPKAIETEVIAYLKTFTAPGEEDQRDRIAADLGRAEREAQNWLEAIGQGGDMPVLVARLRAATARVEGLRASLASAQIVADRWIELDPEDLADELPLAQADSPDLTADRKVLRSLGVTITVDRELKEAVIQGNLGQIVASRLSSDAQNMWEARG